MISNENILKLKKRREIYNFIDKNPGFNIRQISNKMNIPFSTLDYHLNHLKKLGLIKEEPEGKSKLIFASMKIGKKDKKILQLLRQEIPCKIFLYLIFSVVFSQIEASKELNINPVNVNYYLKKMLKMGILEEAPACNGIIYPFKDDTNYKIEEKPTKSEKFYRRNLQEFSENDINRVLITYKHSLFDENIIDSYIDYLPELMPELKKFKSTKYRFNKFADFLIEFYKPPFAY